MSGTVLIIVLLALTAVAFHLGRRRAFSVSVSLGGAKNLHSLPNYYGSLTALWCALPAIIVFGVWMSFESQIVGSLVVADLPEETRALPPQRLNLVVNDIRNLAEGNIVSGEVVPEMRAAANHYIELRRTSAAASAVVVLAIAIEGMGMAWRRVSPALRARNQVEQIVRILLIASSTVPIFATLGIVLSVLFEALRFFSHIGITDFVFGLDWSPQMAIREDQVGSSGAFGAIPLFAGTLLVSFIAIMFPDVKGRKAKRAALYRIVSPGAGFMLRERVLADPGLIGRTERIWVPADDDIDILVKGHIDRNAPESERRVKNDQIAWVTLLEETGRIEKRFNTTFFTAGDSREPELAGIRGAAVGSFYTLLVTLVLSFPIGVAAAVYLEEFAPTNRLTDIIEVNINNLAAVPSIIFGLLGLAVFINFFGLQRSAPLVGGLVLTLMTLPTIIIASRAALKSVPPSIREAALGMGASKMQTITHHVLPLAMPGMLTGTIIGMAQALGESAPLLMIGMVAFIVDVPGGPLDPSTVLPVQIFLWVDSPEPAFVERTSAAIMVLLAFLITMNAIAVVLRRRFERRW